MAVATKLISNTLTWTGTKITKLVGRKWPSYPNGAPALTKVVEYPKTSPLAQMGINRVVIETAGKGDKMIRYYSGGDCLFAGLKSDKSYTEQLRRYFKAKRSLVKEPVSRIHHNELSVTTTASGTKNKRILAEYDGREAFGQSVELSPSTQAQSCFNYWGTINEPCGSQILQTRMARLNDGEVIVGSDLGKAAAIRDFNDAFKNYFNSRNKLNLS